MEKRDLSKNAPSQKETDHRAKAKWVEAARELSAQYQQEKVFYRTVDAIDHKINFLSDLQRPQNNMPDNMKKYLATVLEQSRKATLDIRRAAKKGQVDTNYLSELQKELDRTEKGLNEFQMIMIFRSKTPTAKDILDRYSPNIPENFLKDQESRKTLYWKKLQEIQKKEEETDEELEKFLEAPNKHIANLVKGSSICIGIDSKRLEENLQQGRLEAAPISSIRSYQLEMEQALYGFPLDLPPALRPIEGYLTSHEDCLRRSKHLKSPIIVRLEESVAERTTFTLSASQGECTDGTNTLLCRPVPYNQPSIDAFPLNTELLESSYASLLDLSKAKHIEDFPCQAQILGGVPIDDVHEVIFTSPRRRDAELERLLEKRGIPYRTVKPENYELGMDWMDEKRRLAVSTNIHPEEIKALGPQGIAHVVDMDDKIALEGEKIGWLHLDQHPLTLKQLEEATKWINERLDRGEGVLIHDRTGISRSGSLACAVLITRGHTTDKALRECRFLRLTGKRYVFSPNQEMQLYMFEARYRAQQLIEKSGPYKELEARTDGESHTTPSGTELRRTLPKIDVFNNINIHFDDIEEKHINGAIMEFFEGYSMAERNRKDPDLMKFEQKYSSTMDMYKKALEEMLDFDDLWSNGKRDLASEKWKQWMERSQSDLPDADIATLATNAILHRASLERASKTKSPIENTTSQEVPEEIDMSEIHPSEHLWEQHKELERHHWERIVQSYYPDGLQEKDAIDKFYSKLENHAQSLIENAKIFRVVRLQDLYVVLDNKDKKLPTTMSDSIRNVSKNQAMYGSSKAPIHAYMSDSNDGVLPKAEKLLAKYGMITLRLKKDRVMKRATLAFDNTLEHYWSMENELTVIPRPMTQLDRKVWPLVRPNPTINDLVEAERSHNQNPLDVTSLDDLPKYVEVQVHGGLNIHDIEKVFLPRELPPHYKKYEEILSTFPKLLDECNIEWEYQRGKADAVGH